MSPLWLFLVLVVPQLKLLPCREHSSALIHQGATYPLYPSLLNSPPPFSSPWRSPEGREYVVVHIREGKYGLVDATPEECDPKGRQLTIDDADFSSLAQTGLHSSAELGRTSSITGRPVEEITKLGLPRALSWEGFLSPNEHILSVIKGDNSLVRAMGLTHPQLAKPLFHVLNAALGDTQFRATQRKASMAAVFYNGKEVKVEATGTKGGQESIFDDGITGSIHIRIERPPDPGEERFLRAHYRHLSADGMNALLRSLSHIETGEIQPQYIMRYGFYEGHTLWRTDPLAIAFIFGLRTIEAIEQAFPGRLDRVLAGHIVAEVPHEAAR